MKLNKLTFAIFAFTFLFSTNLSAQTPVELHITHKLSGNSFAFNQEANNDLGNKFTVTRLEYYISKISIKHDGGTVTPIPDHYILVDGGQNVMDALGSYNITSVESVSFHIGVDTPNNHADPSLQPSGHPLAPKSPSMHWGWSAGYRFVAMEGKASASLNQTYEIHALGDQNYFEVTVPVNAVMQSGKLVIPVNADYTAALKGIDVSTGNVITHGDAGEALTLLNNFKSNVFYAGFPVSVASHTKNNSADYIVSPNPVAAGRGFAISFDNNQAADIIVSDIQGRVVSREHKNSQEQTIALQINSAGLYFVKAVYANGSSAVQKLQVQ